MLIRRTTNGWSCLLASFATVLNTSQEILIKEIGHDGSEIVFPKLPEPYCRRSFHIQELIDCCVRRDYMVMGIEVVPVSEANGLLCPIYFPDPFTRMTRHMRGNIGVLTGTTLRGGRHAVAWDGFSILDPASGDIYPFENYCLEVFWRVQSKHY